MSYTITVSGHSVTETPDEAKQLEEQVLASVRSFVGGLNDATSAIFAGQHTGTTDLMAQPTPTPEPTQ